MESVHVEQDNVEDVMVNPGIDVDVLSITAVRVPEIGSFQSETEIPEVVLEVLPLGFACRAFHGAFMRIDVTDRACGANEPEFAWIRPVDFPEVPSCDGGRFGIAISQPVDVDAVCADLDLLHEDVDSVVITGCRKVGEVDGAGLAT